MILRAFLKHLLVVSSMGVESPMMQHLESEIKDRIRKQAKTNP